MFRLLKLVGGKFVIVEDGVPRAVLMSYEEFQTLAMPHAQKKVSEAASRVERINELVTHSQLLDLREEVIQESPEEIRVEPL